MKKVAFLCLSLRGPKTAEPIPVWLSRPNGTYPIVVSQQKKSFLILIYFKIKAEKAMANISGSNSVDNFYKPKMEMFFLEPIVIHLTKIWIWMVKLLKIINDITCVQILASGIISIPDQKIWRLVCYNCQ